MEQFVRTFEVSADTRVLDVGGDLWNWQMIPERPHLTVLNVLPPPHDLPSNVTWVIADATRLPFRDGEFDVAYSNSVVEHLGTDENQQRFASEMRRVARAYYVQTPNRWFPIEPHLIAPFIHYLPRSWQRPLYPFTPWALLNHPTPAAMDQQFRELRLLTAHGLRHLFPSAEIVTERAAGIAKSFIAQDGF
jgi:methyltransferase family protein